MTQYRKLAPTNFLISYVYLHIRNSWQHLRIKKKKRLLVMQMFIISTAYSKMCKKAVFYSENKGALLMKQN